MITRIIAGIVLLQVILLNSLCAQVADNEAKYEQFVKDFAEKIKEKKEMPVQVYVKLRSVFTSRAKANIYNDWATSIKQSLQMVWPDTAVFSHIYHTEIRREAFGLTSLERINLVKVHHVSRDAYASISRLIEQRGYQQALLEYTYAYYPKVRDSLLRVVSQQSDSIVEVALLRDGSLMRTNQCSIALKFKGQLDISSAITDSLLTHALHLSRMEDSIRMKDPFAVVEFNAYEASVLNRLLTPEQYTKVLMIKNKSKAQMDATEDWEEMEQRSMVSTYEEKKVKEQLFNYHLARLATYYRNANNLVKRKASLLALQQNLPKAIKDLNMARNQTKIVDKTSIQPKW